MSKIKSFKTPMETAEALALHIKEQVVSVKENFFLAVSGGSTPKMLFEAMVKIKEEIPWKKIQLFWVDERCVPPTDDESNYKMTVDALLKKVPLPVHNIHRVKGELNPENGLSEYKKEVDLVPVAERFPQFDLIILGIGDDGHTASVFPTELHLLKAPSFLAIGTNPYSNQKRITLTGPTINNAKEIIFHVTGKTKASVVSRIISQKDNYLDFPGFYIAQNEKATWYVDHDVFHS